MLKGDPYTERNTGRVKLVRRSVIEGTSANKEWYKKENTIMVACKKYVGIPYPLLKGQNSART